MRAVVVNPDQKRSARLLDVPCPQRQPEEYLVRVLEVGIDGTDREIDAGLHGAAPPGEDKLVIGHESLGEVIEPCPGDEGFSRGDLVVATVRRPCPQRCLNCRNGEYDFCLTGHYRERGIKQRNGFLAEFYAERPEFLVHVPAELRSVAVLLEPLSVVEKAFRQARRIQQRMASTDTRRVIITGAGAIGMCAALLARLQDIETLVYSRGPKHRGVRGAILDALGTDYIDSDTQSLEDATRTFGAPDLIFEATGFSPFALQCAQVLHSNGVACLLSVTGGERMVQIDAARFNEKLVLGNRVMFGSVSSHRCDFEQGVRDMQAAGRQWPGLLERFITDRIPMERFRQALDDDDPGELKTVLQVHSP
jgi:threonine dehydrogenase-like Zn-dependent dehydrogenase